MLRPINNDVFHIINTKFSQEVVEVFSHQVVKECDIPISKGDSLPKMFVCPSTMMTIYYSIMFNPQVFLKEILLITQSLVKKKKKKNYLWFQVLLETELRLLWLCEIVYNCVCDFGFQKIIHFVLNCFCECTFLRYIYLVAFDLYDSFFRNKLIVVIYLYTLILETK